LIQDPLRIDGPVLVTGGSGFIGSHLVRALIAQGAEVVNLDIKPPTLAEHADLWSETNLLDLDAVTELLKRVRPSVIFNLAAHASLSGDASDLLVNVKGVETLVTAIKSAELSPLLIHTSTQLVAGPATDSFDPLAFQPYGPYGESKAISEQLLRDIADDLNWTIVRPTNIWGAYHPSFARSIWRYIKLGLYLHPDGYDPVRSYGYVGNVVEQLLAIAKAPLNEVRHDVFYVGDEPVPSSLWLDGFSRALNGKPVKRIPHGLLSFLARCGDISLRLGGPGPINSGRLERMTSDFPTPMAKTFERLGRGPYSFDTGVTETVRWLRPER
jgi:nucleoside-diphosphate-sugar epimerase